MVVSVISEVAQLDLHLCVQAYMSVFVEGRFNGAAVGRFKGLISTD